VGKQPDGFLPVFETTRLWVRPAVPADAEMFAALWNNPHVMANVGFPHGLELSLVQITAQLAAGLEQNIHQRRLVVVHKNSGELIGECHLGQVDENGLAETDVKLLPEFWGHSYGVEIKQGLLDYLFTHTPCQVVQATPNVHNTASIRMQEAVGGERVFEFPAHLQARTTPVHAYVYHVRRAVWAARKAKTNPESG
jgi:RimJ/RimL family protein N-acetyltransferase